MKNSLEQITKITGPDLLKNPDPLVILFSTTWCGECMIIESLLCKLKQELKTDISIYKVDAEKDINIKEFFGVRHLPTIIAIRNSMVVNTLNGVTSKRIIRNCMEGLIYHVGLATIHEEQLYVR